MSELPTAAAAKLAAQLAELAEEFQRSVPARLDAIEAAIVALGADCDVAALCELCTVAHRLVGAAGTFGDPVLGAAAQEIEALAKKLEAEPAARADAAQAAFSPLLVRLQAAASVPGTTSRELRHD